MSRAIALQMRLLITSRRPLFVLALYTGIWFLFEMLWRFDSLPGGVFPQLWCNESAAGLGVVASMCWGIMVWRDESPRDRDYHWSLPVDCSMHDAARAVAGFLWLIVAVSWYLLWSMIVFGMHGLAGAAISHATPQSLLSMYTTAFLAYCLSISYSTMFDHAAEWLLATLFALFVLAVTAAVPATQTLVLGLFTEPFGLFSTVFPGQNGHVTGVHLDAPGRWLVATVIWIVVVVLLFGLSLIRNRRYAR
jgi:hypothetical protein